MPKILYRFLKYHTGRAFESSRYAHLYDAIIQTKAQHILEIGVWDGERAARMIYVSSYNGSNCHYYGFDLFEDLDEDTYKREISKRPLSNNDIKIKLADLGAQVHLFPGNTLDTLPEEVNNLPKMDFIFIDGGHNIDTIRNDWFYCSELMHQHTIVIFDDYWHNRTDHGAKLIVDDIDRSRYDVEVLPEIDSFENKDFGRLDISFAKVYLK